MRESGIMGKARCSLLYFRLARVSELYDFHRQQLHGADWTRKGHAYPWILVHGEWDAAKTALELVGGYSDLASHINTQYGTEVWAADDFGMESNEPFWERGKDPKSVIERFPNVKYVFKRLGDTTSSDFPHTYFDRIYSVSAVEHIPPEQLG